ncbi:MAG TPA: hypothetical protein VFA20_25450 [Myxococcaceae bacterium]|nr:hypothetical protein [Myxococcaceae bacterium]
MEILAAIGNTSMVQLRKVTPANGARILSKLEWENPTKVVAERLGPRANVVTLMADSGLKHLSTGVYGRPPAGA